MNKKIFILWLQGFDNAPKIVTKCVKTWEILNHDWEVVRLDKSNLHRFIDLNEIVPNYEQKKISEASLSDMIRLLLLKKYGGLWVDATMFCNEPLSNWFSPWESSHFSALPKSRAKQGHLIATFFLYSSQQSYIINRWCEETTRYWKNKNKTEIYSWVHYRFNEAWDNDKAFKNYFKSSDCKKFDWYEPSKSNKGVGFVGKKNLVGKLTSDVFKLGKESVACKLTHKTHDVKVEVNSLYNYLI